MDQKQRHLQQQTRPGQAGIQAQDAEAQADGLMERSRELQVEQAALAEFNTVEESYGTALAVQIEAKHDQAERIEDRLEKLIEQQASKLQQCRSEQPALIALPGARARWQQKLEQQQSTMQRLQGRLEGVREIKDGMSIHGPRIEELAIRRLRHQDPGLASQWAELQEAQRLNQAHQRRMQKEKEQREQQRTAAGLSQTLTISNRLV
ncbi:IncP plasmid survival protein KfrC family protein [Massilia soli]|uniref:Conjugal transfer protein n=1 Tax=Massilia soli TaxID=2792854 RepID=A0ABS7SKU0_9BURK|nr:IncP plasmid survival protein KfrC family protein [Massilia soli]MBZ2206554.1 hypothetical protein [Massilia soli]